MSHSNSPKSVEPRLELCSISKAFAGVPALRNINLTSNRGKIVGLVGANGAGKSTLVKVLSGQFPDYTGRILVDGQPISMRSPKAAIRAGIATVPQDPALSPELTITQNIGLADQRVWYQPSSRSHDASSDNSSIELLRAFDAGLSAKTRAAQLSRNQLQVVQIVKALAIRPSVLVLDEPTTGLTQNQVTVFQRELREVAGRDGSILYISHQLEQVLAFCDEVIVLRDGELIFRGDTNTTSLSQLRTKMFGFMAAGRLEAPALVDGAREVASFRNITTSHFEDLSFSVKEGETLGLVAPTSEPIHELLKSLCGVKRLKSGTIHLQGKSVSLTSPASASAHGVCYLSDERRKDSVFPNLSVAFNITLPVISHFSFLGGIHRTALLEVAAEEARRFLVTGAPLDAPITFLSGGNQQKAVLARLLLNSPKLLFLHEPFGGIDVHARAGLIEALGVFRQRGAAIVFASTEPDDLLTTCSSFVFLRDGKICAVSSRTAVDRSHLVAHFTGTSCP
jgi:ribose transport system ATP-binding protein